VRQPGPARAAAGRASDPEQPGGGRLKRLSPLDASDRRAGRYGQLMNAAALAILQASPLLDRGGELAPETARGAIGRRPHPAPRLRQVLFAPRFGRGRPLRVDAPGFDIGEHVPARRFPRREMRHRCCASPRG
jgi:hypothetical protein